MNILVVDDHKLYREGLITVINHIENVVQIIEACDGAQALHTLATEDIDLAIIDFHLSDTTGAVLLHKIKNSVPETPVIIMSGADNSAMIKSIMAGGASGFLPKTMQPDELINAINAVLNGEIYFPENLFNKAQENEINIASGQGFDYSDLLYLAKITQKAINTSDWSLRAKHNSSNQPDIINGFNQLLAKMEAHYNELKEHAFHDVLTELPNRRLFTDRLDQAMNHALRNKDYIGLLTIDVDKFKKVNDELGHDQGDSLLKAIADRLKASVRDIDTVSRFGGDEFAVILTEIGDTAAVESLLTRMLSIVREPLCLAGNTLVPSVSIGVVISDGSVAADKMLKQADDALYQVKRDGRNGFKIYEE